MRALGRIALSFGCVLLAVALYSFPGLLSYKLSIRAVFDLMPITLLFALPAWLLSLPLVITFKDAEGRRGWIILITGVALGPAFLLLWGLVAPSGGIGHMSSQADGFFWISALIVSLLTTISYVLALKIIQYRSIRSEATKLRLSS